MKLSDVVSQLQLVLPKYTDYFSNTLGITSIVASGGVATIVTSSVHGLVTGRGVTISDVESRNGLSAVSKDGNVYTFTTDVNHDLTLDYPGYATVKLAGFPTVDPPDFALPYPMPFNTHGGSFPEWNDDFALVDVPDRLNFKVRSANGLPVLSTTEFLNEIRIDGINGRYSATVIDTTTFTVTGSFNDGTYNSGTVKTGVRIAGSVSIQRAFEQYTKQNLSDMWMFVVMSDANVSKNRNAYSDATATIVNGEDIRTRLVDGFSIYLIASTTADIAAVDAMDIARHDLLSPILKSVFGARFSTGLDASSDFRTILLGHSLYEYTKSALVYQYGFEFTSDITGDDAVIDMDTRAFSEVDYTQVVGGDDVTEMTAETELPN